MTLALDFNDGAHGEVLGKVGNPDFLRGRIAAYRKAVKGGHPYRVQCACVSVSPQTKREDPAVALGGIFVLDSRNDSWLDCAVEDEMKFDELISTGPFADKVPNVVAELPTEEEPPTIH